MATYPHLSLPNNPNKDIWSYYELLQVGPIAFDDHSVIVLQGPLVNKSPIINVY